MVLVAIVSSAAVIWLIVLVLALALCRAAQAGDRTDRRHARLVSLSERRRTNRKRTLVR